jgi:hypothetical protein
LVALAKERRWAMTTGTCNSFALSPMHPPRVNPYQPRTAPQCAQPKRAPLETVGAGWIYPMDSVTSLRPELPMSRQTRQIKTGQDHSEAGSQNDESPESNLPWLPRNCRKFHPDLLHAAITAGSVVEGHLVTDHLHSYMGSAPPRIYSPRFRIRTCGATLSTHRKFAL